MSVLTSLSDNFVHTERVYINNPNHFNQLVEYKCKNKCCTILIKEYTDRYTQFSIYPRKAGALIYDPQTDSVLLVQSRGQYWGIPKGTLEDGETSKTCAIREVYEETGILLSSRDFKDMTRIKNRAVYFYVEMDKIPVTIQEHNDNDSNDANGICWIKLDCLDECIRTGNISLNSHTKLVLARFLGKIFSKSNFVKVYRKK